MLVTAMAGFVPVEVAPEGPEPPPAATGGAVAEAPGTVELVLPSGATVRIVGQVDAALLRIVLAELRGR